MRGSWALLTPARQDHRRFPRHRGRVRGWRRLLLRLPLCSWPAELAKRLTLYKLRAKVAIEDLSPASGVIAIWGDGANGETLGDLALAYADPRAGALGLEADRASAASSTRRSRPWEREAGDAGRLSRASRHRLGIGPKRDSISSPGDAFPHEINMDQLGGVDFRQGLLRRPGGRVAHAASRHRPHAAGPARLTTPGFAPMEGAPVDGRRKAARRRRHLPLADGSRHAPARPRRRGSGSRASALTAGGLPARIVKPDWWTAAWPLPMMPA